MRRAIPVLLSLFTVCSGFSQTSEKTGSLEYLEFERNWFTLLPGKPLSVPGETITDFSWQIYESALVIASTPTPAGQDRLIQLLKTGDYGVPKTISSWRPGDTAPKFIYRSKLDENVRDVTLVTNTDWAIIEVLGKNSAVRVINTKTNAMKSLAIKDVSVHVAANYVAGAPPVLVLEKTGVSFQVFLLDMKTGNWIPTPFATPENHNFLGVFSVPEKGTVAFGFSDKENFRNGKTFMFDPVTKMIKETLPKQAFGSFQQEYGQSFLSGMGKGWGVRRYGDDEEEKIILSPKGFAGTSKGVIGFDMTGFERASMSHEKTFVAGLRSGVLSIQAFIQLAPAEAKRIIAIVDERELAEQGDWIGYSLIEFAEEGDGTFPPLDGFAEIMETILREPQRLDNFEFYFHSKKLSEITDRKTTVIGKLKGRFGYSLIYADKTVRYFLNPTQ
jgi:hypothetical protein